MQYEDKIRAVVLDMMREQGGGQELRLETDTDLSQAGFNSLTFVDLIIRLEDVFGISVPDDQLLFSAAGTIRKLCGIVAAQKGAPLAPEL